MSFQITRTLKNLTLASLAGGLFMLGLTSASHDGDVVEAAAAIDFGDAYTLATDPVTGGELGPLKSQVTLRHEGREFRFASAESAKTFKASPDKFIPAVDTKLIANQLASYPLDTCLISGGKLGSMGDPIDLIVGNRLVRLCCGGCIKKVKKNAAKSIATLDAAVIKAQLETYAAKTCPVSGGELGGMGEPVNVVIGNRLVRLCCKGCISKLNADPIKFLTGKTKANAAAGGCCSDGGDAAGGGCGDEKKKGAGCGGDEKKKGGGCGGDAKKKGGCGGGKGSTKSEGGSCH